MRDERKTELNGENRENGAAGAEREQAGGMEMQSWVLHCCAFGNLVPEDICEGCEGCTINHEFADKGGKPAMLLKGSRENLAAALRAPGVAMNDVVVVNAKRFQAMENTLERFIEVCAMYDCDDFCEELKPVLEQAKKMMEVTE